MNDTIVSVYSLSSYRVQWVRSVDHHLLESLTLKAKFREHQSKDCHLNPPFNWQGDGDCRRGTLKKMNGVNYIVWEYM